LVKHYTKFARIVAAAKIEAVDTVRAASAKSTSTNKRRATPRSRYTHNASFGQSGEGR
jgi:hypothetical protein